MGQERFCCDQEEAPKPTKIFDSATILNEEVNDIEIDLSTNQVVPRLVWVVKTQVASKFLEFIGFRDGNCLAKLYNLFLVVQILWGSW